MNSLCSITPLTARGSFRAMFLFLSSSVLALPVVSLPGCGEAKPSCTPGQSIACAGNGCAGRQVCNADGKAYGECQCDSNQGLFPATGQYSGLIGGACTGPASCRAGFDCLTADSKLINGKGPSAGICLAKCLPDHDFCKELDARSRCITLDNGGTLSNTLDDISYCLPGCKMGTQANELDKCRGRADLACSESPAGSGAGYCVPACRSDIDCAGRFCDLSTGLCQDSPRVGDPIGAACAPGAAASSCAGACTTVAGGYAECSGVCNYDTPGCGQTDNSLPLSYYCFHDPAISSGTASGVGDLGYCAKLCNSDRECLRTDAVCEPMPSLAAKTGRAGVCGSKQLSTGAPRPNLPG